MELGDLMAHFVVDKTRRQTIPDTPDTCGIHTSKPFEKELKWLQEQDLITPLAVNETAEWCNSLVLVPKSNGRVRLCLEPAQLNQTLIRLLHRGPTLNNILKKLNLSKYLSIINASFWYHSLKLEGRSSLHHEICMSIWEVHVQLITVWSSIDRRQVLEEN